MRLFKLVKRNKLCGTLPDSSLSNILIRRSFDRLVKPSRRGPSRFWPVRSSAVTKPSLSHSIPMKKQYWIGSALKFQFRYGDAATSNGSKMCRKAVVWLRRIWSSTSLASGPTSCRWEDISVFDSLSRPELTPPVNPKSKNLRQIDCIIVGVVLLCYSPTPNIFHAGHSHRGLTRKVQISIDCLYMYVM